MFNEDWHFRAQIALQKLADCYASFLEKYQKDAGNANSFFLGMELSEWAGHYIRDANACSNTRDAKTEQAQEHTLFGSTHVNPLNDIFAFENETYKDLFGNDGKVRRSLNAEKVGEVLKRHFLEEKEAVEAAHAQYLGKPLIRGE